MGIHNLHKLLKAQCPDAYHEVELSDFAFKKVAIDISLYLCKFKTVCGDRWLAAFINLISCLRRNNIHCVFIYDNGAPPEKSEERAERAANKEKLEEKVFQLEWALENYERDGEIDACLSDLFEKKKDKTTKRLLGPQNRNDQKLDMRTVKDEISRIKGYILNITKEDYALTRHLFEVLGVPYYDAPLEAETACADLCRRGLVDAVLSEDTDVLAYGAPTFLSKINTSTGTCVMLRHQEILEQLDLTEEQFLDVCIMCGTDYNKNIPKVGPANAYKLITIHGSIEGVASGTGHDVSILKHLRGRELFTQYDKMPLESVPYCTQPDFEEVEAFVVQNKLPVNVKGLRKSFVQELIIYED